MMEDYQTDGEPYMSGAWFLDVDELYHRGMSSPWYTYQIRLAVEYDAEILAKDKTLPTKRNRVCQRSRCMG